MSYIEPAILLGGRAPEADNRNDASASQTPETASSFAHAFTQAQSDSNSEEKASAKAQAREVERNDVSTVAVENTQEQDSSGSPMPAPDSQEDPHTVELADKDIDARNSDIENESELQLSAADVVELNSQTDENTDFFAQLFNQVNFQTELKPIAKEVNQLLNTGDDVNVNVSQEMRAMLAELTPQQLKQLNALVQQMGKEQGVSPELLKQLDVDLKQLIQQGSTAGDDSDVLMPVKEKAAPQWLAGAAQVKSNNATMALPQDTPDELADDLIPAVVVGKEQGKLGEWVSSQAQDKNQLKAPDNAQTNKLAAAINSAKVTESDDVSNQAKTDAQSTSQSQKLPPLDIELVIQKGQHEGGKVVQTAASAVALDALSAEQKNQVTVGDKVLERVSRTPPISEVKEMTMADELSAARVILSKGEGTVSTSPQAPLSATPSASSVIQQTQNSTSAARAEAALKEVITPQTQLSENLAEQMPAADSARNESNQALGAKLQQFAQMLLGQVQTSANAGTTTELNAAIEADLVHWQHTQSVSQVATQSAQNAQKQSLPLDPALMQAINITKSDAAQQLHQRVNMLLNLSNQQAEIRLDPPELGSMQVRVRSEGEQAHVNFVVQNQQAKEALEQTMPRLRELLAQQGLALGDTNVEQQGQQQEFDGNESQFAGQQQNAKDEEVAQDEQLIAAQQKNASSKQGIDFYA
ncbi:flagellar hook-length control protein FliK [Pseudoalteromonas sp. YIC-656]|uniref:flagellar hook-length control protein FliK n=1 Tax=Pseudoalteromonas pernae TaxID=3118054 RepID=UPI003242554F